MIGLAQLWAWLSRRGTRAPNRPATPATAPQTVKRHEIALDESVGVKQQK